MPEVPFRYNTTTPILKMQSGGLGKASREGRGRKAEKWLTCCWIITSQQSSLHPDFNAICRFSHLEAEPGGSVLPPKIIQILVLSCFKGWIHQRLNKVHDLHSNKQTSWSLIKRVIKFIFKTYEWPLKSVSNTDLTGHLGSGSQRPLVYLYLMCQYLLYQPLTFLRFSWLWEGIFSL